MITCLKAKRMVEIDMKELMIMMRKVMTAIQLKKPKRSSSLGGKNYEFEEI